MIRDFERCAMGEDKPLELFPVRRREKSRGMRIEEIKQFVLKLGGYFGTFEA